MKLYLLTRKSGSRIGYDECAGFVIRAVSPKSARRIASQNAGDENRVVSKPWLDPEKTDCKVLNSDGEGGVVLCDFRAG